MKPLKSFLTLALMASYVSAFSIGVTFEQGTWTDVIAKAKKETKLIFVDAYTDWCGWCKVMDKETFPDEKIGELFSANFIAYKINMEVGDGIKMAMKYRVQSYPSYLIFNPDGKLLYKTVGYQKADEFLKTLTASLDKKNQMNYPSTFENLDVTYPDIYKAVFETDKKKRKTATADDAAKYLDTQKDLFSEVNWSVMFRFTLTDKYRDVFLANIDKYKELYGDVEVNDKLGKILSKTVKQAADKKDEKALQYSLSLVDKYIKEGAENQKLMLQMDYFQEAKQWAEYADVTIKYIDKNGANDENLLNLYAWDFYVNISDKQFLSHAERWAKKAVEMKDEHRFNDTYAAVLYKLGKKEEAFKVAQHAIELGKKENVNTKETESLIEKIKLMK